MEKRWVARGVCLAVAGSLVLAAWAEFSIQSVSITNNNVRVAWLAPGGSNYVVQVATGNAGGFTNTFTDLSPVIFVPGTAEVLTNYTHTNGALNVTSRFYRVRSFPAAPVLQSIQLWPTNSIIPVDMVNRFRAIGKYSDASESDLTGLITLTSLTPTRATIQPFSNDFCRIYGVASGIATVRVSYASVTNVIPQRVAQMTDYTINPSSLTILVGQSDAVRFFGEFANDGIFGKPLSSTEFDFQPSSATVSYANSAPADVANAYAVVTAVSYQSSGTTVSGGGINQQWFGTWCTYDSIQISPAVTEISVGQTQQFAVVGYNGYGARDPATDGVPTDFTVNDSSVLQNLGNGQFVALQPGSTTVEVTAFNFGGCNDLFDTAFVTVVFPPPSNDDFANHFVLAGTSVVTNGTTNGATGQSGEPLHAGLSNTRSTWWEWSAPAGGQVTISTCGSSFDTVLAVYTGTALDALTTVASNDDHCGLQSAVNFTANAGNSYLIAIDGFGGVSGDYVLNISYPAPSNDNFANRITLTGSAPAATGNNLSATRESGEPTHAAGNSGGKSVWWQWKAPSNGFVTIFTCGSNFDTLLGVYSGTAVNSLTLVASNDDFCGLQSQVTFAATAGTTYQIAVDGYKYFDEPEARSGNIVLTVAQ